MISVSSVAKRSALCTAIITVLSSRTGQSEEDSDGGLDIELEGKGSSLMNIATGVVPTPHTGGATGDFFFGDGEIDPLLDYDPLTTEQNGQVDMMPLFFSVLILDALLKIHHKFLLWVTHLFLFLPTLSNLSLSSISSFHVFLSLPCFLSIPLILHHQLLSILQLPSAVLLSYSFSFEQQSSGPFVLGMASPVRGFSAPSGFGGAGSITRSTGRT